MEWLLVGTARIYTCTVAPTRIGRADPHSRIHKLTPNGVFSVSLAPPLALACVGHDRNSHQLIKTNRRFAISILNTQQRNVALHYTDPPERRGPDDAIPFVKLGESMAIGGSLAAMDCRVISEHEEGDHTLFIAEVERLTIGEGEPMLWLQGQFGRFTAE